MPASYPDERCQFSSLPQMPNFGHFGATRHSFVCDHIYLEPYLGNGYEGALPSPVKTQTDQQRERQPVRLQHTEHVWEPFTAPRPSRCKHSFDHALPCFRRRRKNSLHHTNRPPTTPRAGGVGGPLGWVTGSSPASPPQDTATSPLGTGAAAASRSWRAPAGVVSGARRRRSYALRPGLRAAGE